MKLKIYSIITFFVIFFLPGAFAQMATNPIIYADVPDPDFVRVGDTYYMSSTTMYFNPGVPIMKSNDLVNWELINYCYPIMADTDALNLKDRKEAYSGGTWASSINYYEGTFYVSTFSYTTGKTYIYKTTNIESGPWTTITLNKVYHDHSLFFDDDGKVYIAYGHDNIQLTEMKPDLSGEQPGGVNKVIINKASSVAGNNFILTAEGTRLQKINGQYYVSNICWPSGKGRTQIIHRSASIAGTYTGKVVFQSSAGSAQGEYIDTPDGKWYAMFFHDHGSLGRIPDLMPVTWTDDWPVVGVNGQVPATLDISKGDGSLRGIIDSDEFAAAPPLKLQWQWNHNPQNDYWSLTQKEGYLRLTNERTDANVLQTTNTLTQRTFGAKCSGYVAVDVSGMKDGDYAGLVALQNKYGWVGVKMSGTSKSIVMGNGSGFTGTTSETGNILVTQNNVYLRIDFDFTNRTDKANFFYSLNGTSWTPIGTTLQMTYDLEHFTGYRFGLFSYATKSSGGYVDFDFFRVGATISEAQNSQNIPPVVSITSPLNNSTFNSTDTIMIIANVTDTDGISNVEFFAGSKLIGIDSTTPYSMGWKGMETGSHNITAKATDVKGAAKTSAPVILIIKAERAPFKSGFHKIPGRIEAEEYDLGGEGVGFHEANSEGNQGRSNFRNDEVDIEGTTDVDGDYHVGYILQGEWLEYSIEVANTGNYDLDIRVASDGDDKALRIIIDGEDVSGPVIIPNTGGWQEWSTVKVPGIGLSTGKHIMRISFEGNYFNLNYVQFSETITSIRSEATEKFSIYPNPFSQRGVQISKHGEFTYHISDEMGAILSAGKGKEKKTVGEHLIPGIYLLYITHNDMVSVHKVVKL